MRSKGFVRFPCWKTHNKWRNKEKRNRVNVDYHHRSVHACRSHSMAARSSSSLQISHSLNLFDICRFFFSHFIFRSFVFIRIFRYLRLRAFSRCLYVAVVPCDAGQSGEVEWAHTTHQKQKTHADIVRFASNLMKEAEEGDEGKNWTNTFEYISRRCRKKSKWNDTLQCAEAFEECRLCSCSWL